MSKSRNSGMARAGLALAVVATLAVAGCREEEQGRMTNFEPGVYKGPEDQALDPEVVNSLRARAMQGQSTP